MRFLFLLGLMTAVLPAVVFAQLVPCGNIVDDVLKECGWSDLLTLGENILNFIIVFSVTVSAIVFAYAGFLYFSAGGDSNKISKARSLFGAVVIGLIVILTAWLIVNTILVTLTEKGLNDRKIEEGLIGN